VYSSKTGNTRKLAEGIHRGLEARGIEAAIAPVEDAPQAAAWVLAGYWVDRGTADKKALKYLKSLKGARVGLFGTLGAYPDSQHAADTARKVEALVGKKNRCLGTFLCQGKIDPKIIEFFKKLPLGHPHGMNEERIKRHAEAAKHPNDDDIAAALEVCVKMLEAADKAEA
jgi:flavodoxin